MANAPLAGRDGELYSFDLGSEKQKYFCRGDWTGQITLIRFNKLDFSRNAPRARRKVEQPVGQSADGDVGVEADHSSKKTRGSGSTGGSSGIPSGRKSRAPSSS